MVYFDNFVSTLPSGIGLFNLHKYGIVATLTLTKKLSILVHGIDEMHLLQECFWTLVVNSSREQYKCRSFEGPLSTLEGQTFFAPNVTEIIYGQRISLST